MTRGRYGIFGGAAALLCLVAALLGVGGCAGGRPVLTTDTGLTYEALRDGGLALVSVTVKEEVEQVRPPLNAALERALREMRPEVRFRTAASVRDSLGLAEYRRILSAYQLEGKLSEADAAVLAAKLGRSSRFALLARVDKDDTRVPPMRRQSTGVVGAASPTFGRLAASRDTRFRISLYDLSTGREAWGNVYASSSDNVLPDSVPRLPAKLPVPRPGTEAEIPLEPLPEVPSLAEALVEGFRAFATDLPRPANTPAAPH